MYVGMRIFDDFIFMKPFIVLQTTIYFTLRKKVKVHHSLLTDTLFDGLLFNSKRMNRACLVLDKNSFSKSSTLLKQKN